MRNIDKKIYSDKILQHDVSDVRVVPLERFGFWHMHLRLSRNVSTVVHKMINDSVETLQV